MHFRQSFGVADPLFTRSQMSNIRLQFSVVLFSLVAFSMSELSEDDVPKRLMFAGVKDVPVVDYTGYFRPAAIARR